MFVKVERSVILRIYSKNLYILFTVTRSFVAIYRLTKEFFSLSVKTFYVYSFNLYFLTFIHYPR